MDEPVPGILHWTAYHDGIGQTVHSHFAVAAGAVFDPLLPEGGVEALADAGIPSVVLLSNRHHLRHAAALHEAYGCAIRCHEAGLHEFEGEDVEVEGFRFGDEVAPGVTALEVGVLCPEETAFAIDAGPGALLFADAVIRSGDQLEFVPDGLLGDDPRAVRAGLGERFAALADRGGFDALLFAHGLPLARGGREALADFAR